MYIYIFIFVANLFFNIKTNKTNFFYFLFFILLTSILGLRGIDVGIDTEHYYISYSMIAQDAYPIKDFLYYVIVKSLLFFGLGAEAMIFFFALLTIFPISYVVYKESYSPMLSFSFLLALGFYSFYFNGMRQGASISFGFLCVYFYSNNMMFKSFWSFLVAFGLHASSILLLPFIFILSLNVSYFQFLIIILWLVSIYSALFGDIFYFLLKTFSFMIPERFHMYIVASELKPRGVSFLFDQLIFIYLYYMLQYVKDLKDVIYIRLGMFGITCMYLFSGVEFVGRAAMYYYIFVIMSVPSTIYYISKPSDRSIVLGVFLSCLLIQHIFRISLNPHDIIPYYFFF